MDLHAELARLNPDVALPDWVPGAVQTLLDRVQQTATEATRQAAEATRQLAHRDTELHAALEQIKGGEIEVHAFRTLTLCPIDLRLVDRKLLTAGERRWLNRYHARVRKEISPLIEDARVLVWLEQATRKI